MKCPVPECGEEMTVWFAAGKMNVARCVRNHEFPPDLLEAGRITIAPLPKPEPWKPRTKAELMDQWDDEVGDPDVGDPAWDIQARTDDIARMLSEGARQQTGLGNDWVAMVLEWWATRIRELE